MTRFFKTYLKAFVIILSVFLFYNLPASAVAADTCSYNFSWLPYTGFNTVKYEIHYGTDPNGPYPNVVDQGNPSPMGGRIYGSVDELPCCRSLYFVVVAVSSGSDYTDDSREVEIIGVPTYLRINK